MTLQLITKEEYDTLKDIYNNHKNLFLQNNGYEYLDKSKFTNDDKEAFETMGTHWAVTLWLGIVTVASFTALGTVAGEIISRRNKKP